MNTEPSIPTVIYTHGGGRLGNQILRWLHWLAWVRAHEGSVRVVDLSFLPYARLFEAWAAAPGCVTPDSVSWLGWLGRMRSSLGPSGYFRGERRILFLVQTLGSFVPGSLARNTDSEENRLDLDSTEVEWLTRGAKMVFCRGWKIAGWRNVERYQTELRPLFRPARRFLDRGIARISQIRRTYDKVVGVFVRQSDYKTWNNGRFFFPVERYAAWMNEIVAMEEGRKVAFLVASEVRLDKDSFRGLPFVFASGMKGAGGHWFETFVELSMCDIILSPPSTFSATAAYVGNIPFWPLTDVCCQLLDQRKYGSICELAKDPEVAVAIQ